MYEANGNEIYTPVSCKCMHATWKHLCNNMGYNNMREGTLIGGVKYIL